MAARGNSYILDLSGAGHFKVDSSIRGVHQLVKLKLMDPLSTTMVDSIECNRAYPLTVLPLIMFQKLMDFQEGDNLPMI